MDDSDGKKCWTGCVAVAVAQMLYYTHYFLGKPNKLYHSVSCSKQHISGSTTNIGFSRGDLDLDSPRWDMMAKYWYETNTSYVGDLMLDIGNRLGMEYSGEGSGTNLSTTGLANYDLTYTTGDYSYSVVQNNLKKGLPVIVTAGNKVGLSYSGGHAWIIDGVRRRYATYTYEKHIEYSENWMNESEYFESFDEIRWKYNVNDEFDIWYVETSGTTDYLLMNWGYDGSYDDDSYFVDGEWNANGSSHMYKRKIYYDFR